MFILLASWLLVAAVPGAPPPGGEPPSDDCEDARHLELSPPVLTPPRLCISPGTLTGVIFDHPVTVELQDEVRFIEVTRGRMGVAFIPPRDLRPGETLRLTASMSAEEKSQNLTLVLVTHPGHGSHQVEVSYRPRSWQSMTDALNQTLVANQRLRVENAELVEEASRLRAKFAPSMGLCAAFDSGELNKTFGIAARRVNDSQSSSNALNSGRFTSYRGKSNIAVEVEFTRHTLEPWILEKATLVNEQGEEREALRHRQTDALSADRQLTVFAEFDPKNFTPGIATLRLTSTDGRIFMLSHVVFP